jgi:hypothetical protein
MTRRHWRNPWPAAARLLLLLLAIAVSRGTRPAESDHNSLVVESDCAGAVKLRGEWTRITDPTTHREFDCRFVNGEIEVREQPNGVPFFTREFVLRQCGKPAVSVRLEIPKRDR